LPAKAVQAIHTLKIQVIRSNSIELCGAAAFIAAGVMLNSIFAEAADGSSGSVDFRRDIQPIFASRCYECHGEKKHKGGLRLDQKAVVFRGGDSGKPAVVPGRIAESRLLQLVGSSDPDDAMPPKGDRLTPAQVRLLQAWIEQGAAWPDDASAPETKHWAYVSPARPELPAVRRRNWPRNEIDYFVLARLDQEGLRPSPEADRATLLRRVSLDLIGLPPTLEEVDAFLADKSEQAYEKIVDRLLASPHYGERWARPWLDLARYADTQGFEKDDRRSMWPYRDWVIHALNANMPFDRFTIEQIAGDMLPNATRDQKVATGFHRNTMTNTEGGTDDEEFRHEAIVDRVDTTMSVWMATTFGCARCHNHKYDPFATKEYYQFYAFLNNTADSDKDDERPTLKLPTPGQESELKKIQGAIAEVDKRLKTDTPELAEARRSWEERTLAELNKWIALDSDEFTSRGGARLEKKDDRSILATGENPSNDVYTVIARTDLNRVTGIELEVLTDDSLPEKSSGRQRNGNFVLSRFEATLAPGVDPARAQAIVFSRAGADRIEDGYSVTNLIDGKEGPGWSVGAGDAKSKAGHSAYFVVSNRTEFAGGGTLAVTLRHDSKWPDANIGRFRLYVTGEDDPTQAPRVSDAVRKALATAASARTGEQNEELDRHWRSVAPELKGIRDELAKLRKEEADVDRKISRTSVMEELDKPRDTFQLIRGGFLSRGEKVPPGTPAVLHPLPAGQPMNRLTLARWLVDTNNPLTARVTMNRIWAQYFGIGIVETVEDFGTQGEKPSHPELLDWLATEFMRSGWDMKAMHKLIVMSATYRQNSHPTPELTERDPYNRLLARGPRVRLEAEMIRDQALAVSGLLSHKLGGPSVMPPQPDGLWQVVYSGDKWETSRGEDKYRRGLYTFWRRSMPHPAMTTFDAPTREFCVVKRTRSNTPLQALVLLNDPQYIEAAQALARRILSSPGRDLHERVAYAFRLCLARTPTQKEADRLAALYQREVANFDEHPIAAANMATSESAAAPSSMRVSELAAWTVVANVLLNLDEMITKG